MIKFVKGAGEMGKIAIEDMGKFKELYETAKEMRMDSFVFKGKFIPLSYAKYVLKCMGSKYNENR